MKRERARQRAAVVFAVRSRSDDNPGGCTADLACPAQPTTWGKPGRSNDYNRRSPSCRESSLSLRRRPKCETCHAYELHNASLKKRPTGKNKGKERSHNLGAAFSSFPFFLSEKQPSECPAGIPTSPSFPLPYLRPSRPPYRPFPPPSAADLSFRMLPKRRLS